MYGIEQNPSLDELMEELERDIVTENNVVQIIDRIKINSSPSASNPKAKEIDASNSPSVSYRFPLSQARSAIEVKGLVQLSVNELLQWLEELSSRQKPSGTAISYSGTARTLFCAINIELNERRAIAPHFRSMQRPNRNKVQSNCESNQSNDRQVIDLHWLHCEGKRDGLDHEEFTNLFLGDQFDFDLASALASKGWSTEHKSLNILKLIDFEMHQLSWFRSKFVRNRWRNGVTRMNGAIERHLRSQTVRERSFKQHVEGIKKVWLAMYLAGENGPVSASRLYTWMTGQTLAKSTWSAKVQAMKRRTGWNCDA